MRPPNRQHTGGHGGSKGSYTFNNHGKTMSRSETPQRVSKLDIAHVLLPAVVEEEVAAGHTARGLGQAEVGPDDVDVVGHVIKLEGTRLLLGQT